jgi:hypothetical protein
MMAPLPAAAHGGGFYLVALMPLAGLAFLAMLIVLAIRCLPAAGAAVDGPVDGPAAAPLPAPCEDCPDCKAEEDAAGDLEDTAPAYTSESLPSEVARWVSDGDSMMIQATLWPNGDGVDLWVSCGDDNRSLEISWEELDVAAALLARMRARLAPAASPAEAAPAPGEPGGAP